MDELSEFFCQSCECFLPAGSWVVGPIKGNRKRMIVISPDDRAHTVVCGLSTKLLSPHEIAKRKRADAEAAALAQQPAEVIE